MKLINKIVNLLFDFYIAILASIPTQLGVKIRYFAYKPLFKKVKGKFAIDSGVTILGFENIELGKNVYFGKNSYIYANNNGELIIGDNFGMNSNSQLGASFGKIFIGDNCQIAANCVIRSADHNFDNCDIPIRVQGHKYGEIIIEDDVWIASNCVITPNTKIGKSSIVGAGSVVTKNIEPYSIVGGVPAKLIKKRE